MWYEWTTVHLAIPIGGHPPFTSHAAEDVSARLLVHMSCVHSLQTFLKGQIVHFRLVTHIEAGDSTGRTLRLRCCYGLAASILVARKLILHLGRMNRKPRQGGGGRRVSPTDSAVLSLVR